MGERTLFEGGRVVTMRDDGAVHEAAVIEDGRVLATGSRREMDDLARTAARWRWDSGSSWRGPPPARSHRS